jgi:protein-tyrosine phosphatase
VIDLHCHILAGIDDGPVTIEGSLQLARAASAAGIDTIVATPHVSERYRNDSDTIAQLVAELNTRLRGEEIAVEVRPGAEIALTRAVEMTSEQLAELGLGGPGGWLLIEPPFTPAADGIDTIVLDIASRGHRIVVAHPERCPAFQRNRAMLETLVSTGALVSITASSLAGRFGQTARHFAMELARDGLMHNVASDAHDHLVRAPSIAAELREARLQGLAEWLTVQVPGAVLDGEEIPRIPGDVLAQLSPRPASRSRWWQRQRR